jgi:phytanoyl-CoA hydroxylase
MIRLGVLADNPGEFEREFDWGRLEEERQGKGRYRKWLVADYEAGDVVFHYPCSVHASCSNQDEEVRIRLSTDLRFNSKKDWNEGRADERWMKSWGPGDEV